MDIEKIGILEATEWGVNPSRGPIVNYKKHEIVYFKDVPGTKEEVEYMFKCFLDRGIAVDYVGDAKRKEEKNRQKKEQRKALEKKKKEDRELAEKNDIQDKKIIKANEPIEVIGNTYIEEDQDRHVKAKRKYTKHKIG